MIFKQYGTTAIYQYPHNMAPVLVSPWTHFTTPKKESATPENKFKYEPGQATVQRRGHENYPYEDLLPHFPDIHWGPIADDVPYEDKGLRGDSKFRTLLSDVADVFDYTLKIGTEIRGLDLGKLNDVQRDDLARLVAVRGVVFFRGQKGFDVAAQRELGMYFGMLHKVCTMMVYFRDTILTFSEHASSAIPRKGGLEDVHVVYTGDSERTTSSPSRLWHSDVRLRPPITSNPTNLPRSPTKPNHPHTQSSNS